MNGATIGFINNRLSEMEIQGLVDAVSILTAYSNFGIREVNEMKEAYKAAVIIRDILKTYKRISGELKELYRKKVNACIELENALTEMRRLTLVEVDISGQDTGRLELEKLAVFMPSYELLPMSKYASEGDDAEAYGCLRRKNSLLKCNYEAQPNPDSDWSRAGPVFRRWQQFKFSMHNKEIAILAWHAPFSDKAMRSQMFRELSQYVRVVDSDDLNLILAADFNSGGGYTPGGAQALEEIGVISQLSKLYRESGDEETLPASFFESTTRGDASHYDHVIHASGGDIDVSPNNLQGQVGPIDERYSDHCWVTRDFVVKK